MREVPMFNDLWVLVAERSSALPNLEQVVRFALTYTSLATKAVTVPVTPALFGTPKETRTPFFRLRT